MKNGMIWKVITVIIIPVLFFLGNNLIASDKESRARDTDIKTDIELTRKEQGGVNQAILIALAEIKVDLKYVKKNIKENGR